jgi:hypothetical protein
VIAKKQGKKRFAGWAQARRALVIFVFAVAAVSGTACGGDDEPPATPGDAGRSAPAEDGVARGEKAAKRPEGRKASGGEKLHSTDSRRAGAEGEAGLPAGSQGFKPSQLRGIRDAFEAIPEDDQRALERQVDPSKEQCRHAPFLPGCSGQD